MAIVEIPVRASDEEARTLAVLLGIRPLTARLLVNRGALDEPTARRFLDPRLGHLRAPEADGAAMAGFARSADRLAHAVLAGETIGLFGDYDVDGITTCALLASFLRDAGARVVARVAHRHSGYGFSVEMADGFAESGCGLIVTGDCGTSDHDALARARARGVEVIVVDHHQVPEREPAAYALINPHQTSCRFPFKGLASVGVAFYLAAAVRTRLKAAGRDAPDPRELLDLVALGTIADLVPLTDENRVLVAAGLREMARGRRPGLRALIDAAGITLSPDRPLTTYDVSFRLAPLINAPGRIAAAQLALDMLLATGAAATAAAAACVDANVKRRVIQEQVFEAACVQADAAPPARVTVVAGDGWHHGVVGIVAAKLVERYHRPAFVIGLDGGEGRGSARTPAGHGFDLYRALLACGEHLVRYGGHAAAAGLTVARDKIDVLTRALDDEAGRQIGERRASAALSPEAEVGLDEIDERLAVELALLGPFGVGNPEPLFAARGLDVERTRVVGVKHLQITLRQGRHYRDGIAFNLADRDPGVGARVRAAFVPEFDVFRGERRLRLRVRELSSDGHE